MWVFNLCQDSSKQATIDNCYSCHQFELLLTIDQAGLWHYGRNSNGAPLSSNSFWHKWVLVNSVNQNRPWKYGRTLWSTVCRCHCLSHLSWFDQLVAFWDSILMEFKRARAHLAVAQRARWPFMSYWRVSPLSYRRPSKSKSYLLGIHKLIPPFLWSFQFYHHLCIELKSCSCYSYFKFDRIRCGTHPQSPI